MSVVLRGGKWLLASLIYEIASDKKENERWYASVSIKLHAFHAAKESNLCHPFSHVEWIVSIYRSTQQSETYAPCPLLDGARSTYGQY